MARDKQFDSMTVRQAKEIVAKERLRFADSRHIFAVNLLEKAAELAVVSDGEEVVLECESCDGTGECSCHCGDEHDCGDCEGKGMTTDSTSDDDVGRMNHQGVCDLLEKAASAQTA